MGVNFSLYIALAIFIIWLIILIWAIRQELAAAGTKAKASQPPAELPARWADDPDLIRLRDRTVWTTTTKPNQALQINPQNQQIKHEKERYSQ